MQANRVCPQLGIECGNQKRRFRYDSNQTAVRVNNCHAADVLVQDQINNLANRPVGFGRHDIHRHHVADLHAFPRKNKCFGAVAYLKIPETRPKGHAQFRIDATLQNRCLTCTRQEYGSLGHLQSASARQSRRNSLRDMLLRLFKRIGPSWTAPTSVFRSVIAGFIIH